MTSTAWRPWPSSCSRRFTLTDLQGFVASLAHSPDGPVFNPWFESDRDHDRTPQAPEIRRRQLEAYLRLRQGAARWLLIAEALGYNGGHFSGLAMTSERILLGHQRDRGVQPQDALGALSPERTSRPELKPKGFTEPTATVVWGAMAQLAVPADHYVLWNAFPWHPYDPNSGRLSNRKLTRAEMGAARPLLRQFLSIYPGAEVLAVGKVAARALTAVGQPHHELRHPSFGGASIFRSQLAEVVGRVE